jgi:hypothetical protein
MVRSGYAASIAVRMSVSDEAPGSPLSWSPSRSWASSWVLVRLPLCASAIEPDAVDRNVGWAFAHTLEPVVLYRQWPTDMCPLRLASVASSKAWLTSPMSL